jgi:hypothetical protein
VAVSHPYVCLPATRFGVRRRCIDVPPSLSARALFRSGVRGAGSCSRSDSRSFPPSERSSLRRRGVTPCLARWLGSTTCDRSTSSSPWNRPPQPESKSIVRVRAQPCQLYRIRRDMIGVQQLCTASEVASPHRLLISCIPLHMQVHGMGYGA